MLQKSESEKWRRTSRVNPRCSQMNVPMFSQDQSCTGLLWTLHRDLGTGLLHPLTPVGQPEVFLQFHFVSKAKGSFLLGSIKDRPRLPSSALMLCTSAFCLHLHLCENARSPGTGVTSSSCHVDAGNRTQVLWERSQCSSWVFLLRWEGVPGAQEHGSEGGWYPDGRVY